MKKIFTILLVMSCAFAFANDKEPPQFEETNENECRFTCLAPFSASEQPIFEEDEEEASNDVKENETPVACDEEGCEDGKCKGNYGTLNGCRGFPKETQRKASYMTWKRYKVNFGMEKIFMRFPYNPTVTQSSTLLTAYAYDHSIMYNFTGYFPPLGNISPMGWFDEILYSISQYPLSCVSHTVFQLSNGDWVLDYVAHDYVQDLTIKTRAIVTPFNAYTLQCVKPNGARDHFDYFLDSFWVKCDCDH